MARSTTRSTRRRCRATISWTKTATGEPGTDKTFCIHGDCEYYGDVGCSDPADPTETDPALLCDNGLDDDGDGLVDSADPACWTLYIYPSAATELTTEIACDNGADDDGDGLVDVLDPGCVGSLDQSEHASTLACDDGVDQDGDLAVDFPADSDCADALDPFEGPDAAACGNGQDDDGDGAIDAADPSCADPADTEEFVLLDDGAQHVGTNGASWPTESVRVIDGAGPTALSLAPGSAIGHRVVVDGTSSLSITNGAIGEELRAAGASQVTMSAGSVASGVARSRDRTRRGPRRDRCLWHRRGERRQPRSPCTSGTALRAGRGTSAAGCPACSATARRTVSRSRAARRRRSSGCPSRTRAHPRWRSSPRSAHCGSDASGPFAS